jgi:hypothetical protein
VLQVEYCVHKVLVERGTPVKEGLLVGFMARTIPDPVDRSGVICDRLPQCLGLLLEPLGLVQKDGLANIQGSAGSLEGLDLALELLVQMALLLLRGLELEEGSLLGKGA